MQQGEQKDIRVTRTGADPLACVEPVDARVRQVSRGSKRNERIFLNVARQIKRNPDRDEKRGDQATREPGA